MNPVRWAVVLFAALGAAGAVLLVSTFRDPCAGMLRRYVATYDAAKSPCRADADCTYDALPARGPGLCDRARLASSSRDGLAAVERRWAELSCPPPGTACPPTDGARCQKGRCVTALLR